jgi:hypothetical protein
VYAFRTGPTSSWPSKIPVPRVHTRAIRYRTHSSTTGPLLHNNSVEVYHTPVVRRGDLDVVQLHSSNWRLRPVPRFRASYSQTEVRLPHRVSVIEVPILGLGLVRDLEHLNRIDLRVTNQSLICSSRGGTTQPAPNRTRDFRRCPSGGDSYLACTKVASFVVISARSFRRSSRILPKRPIYTLAIQTNEKPAIRYPRQSGNRSL